MYIYIYIFNIHQEEAQKKINNSMLSGVPLKPPVAWPPSLRRLSLGGSALWVESILNQRHQKVVDI